MSKVGSVMGFGGSRDSGDRENAHGLTTSGVQGASSASTLSLTSKSSPSSACHPWGKVVLQLLACSVLGFVFGVALEKTRVFEPQSIRLQMVFERWIMLKMFLSALATSLLSLAMLSVIPQTKVKFGKACDEFSSCFGQKKGILTSCLGPFILGIGMTISGACPGMVLAQVGAWAPNAIFTLLGALVAALIYGLVAAPVERLTRPTWPLSQHQVHVKLKKPFVTFAVPLGLVVAVVVVLMEVFIDYRDDLEHPERLSYNIATTIAWPPFVGGVIVGLIQIPMVLIVEDTIGGSSSYVTVASQWLVTKRLQEKFKYLAGKRTGVGNWWQVFYVCGAILGGLGAAAVSDSLASVQGVGVVEALIGGFLMLIGARLAAGCTSGHGISGVGLLAWLSLLAVPFMFAGAIATAFIMRAADHSLDRLVNSTLSL